MFVLVYIVLIIAPLVTAIVLGTYDRVVLSACSCAVSVGTVAFYVAFVGTDGHVWASDLSMRVADFDTVPVCYRHEPDIVCCGMAGKMTCMIDRRDP